MLNFLKKVIPFLIVFSLVFYFLRTNDFYNNRILIADLGGLPWLYAAVDTLFSIIAAFAVQKEWDRWNGLVDAVKGEADGLEKLYRWSDNFPEPLRTKIHGNIKDYLNIIVSEGWRYSERDLRSADLEAVFDDLSSNIFEVSSKLPQLTGISFALFSRITDSRSKRLLLSSQRMPELLRSTLRFGAFLLIGLSFFIGVKNIWLAYAFTASIACLAYSVFLVITDLEHPLRPGSWHITTKDYKMLLDRIEKTS